MSAASTAPLSVQAGFMEVVSEPADIPVAAGSAEQPAVRRDRTVSNAKPVAGMRRLVSPQSGRALEILGHAIEYLADEFALQAGISSAMNDPQNQALQILMAANRTVYFACPTVPTLWERFCDLWRASRVSLRR